MVNSPSLEPVPPEYADPTSGARRETVLEGEHTGNLRAVKDEDGSLIYIDEEGREVIPDTSERPDPYSDLGYTHK